MFEISKTEHLEAKRLGNEECATILLTDGNASTNIQLNPFLDFMSVKEEKSWNGKVRGVEESKYAAISNSAERKQSNPRIIQKSTFLQRRLLLLTARNHLYNKLGL